MSSNGQSHWSFSKELGNYESNQSIGQITTTQRDNEGNEYGNDEGVSLVYSSPFAYLTLADGCSRVSWKRC
jgi:hypothetical protein